MLAGVAVAAGLWGVLQLLGVGAGLVAIDPDDAESARHAVLGMGAWSVLAPLIAMLVGGYVAAKLANTMDQRVAGAHALVMWGVTAILGIVTTLWLAKAAAVGAAHGADRTNMAPNQAGSMGELSAEAREALTPINQRLRLQGKPQISAEQLISSARAASDDEGFDKDEFIEKLDDKTALSREEAAEVATQLGPRAQSLVTRAGRVTPDEHAALQAAETTGKGLLSLALAILLSLGSAILGAMIALKQFGKRGDGDRDRVVTDRTPHTTAPYPTTTPTNPGV